MPTKLSVVSCQWSVGVLAAVLFAASAGAEPIEPQPFAPDVQARPISESETTASNTLRWKSRPQASSADYYAADADGTRSVPATELTRPIRAGWNITRIDPSVRPAQHVASDAFHDPFGDRRNGARAVPAANEPELVLQPTQAEAGIEELPPPRTLAPVRPAAPTLEMRIASQPRGGERGRLPGGMEAMPPVGAPPESRSTVPCDRIYNDRNCCELETNCHDFRNRLLSDSIRNISLDITPRYNPDLTLEADEADRADKLRLLEVRPWRDRRGAIIATGRMVKFQNGSVVLHDENDREVGKLPIAELGEDELCYITAWWRLPAECPLGGLRTSERTWLATSYAYHASALCHKPLYFEEVQLERYGHTAGPFRQPILSGAHFIISLAALPYQMAISPPMECEYSLGYYRPGNCAPWMIPPIPLSLRGASAEVAAALGMAYLIP